MKSLVLLLMICIISIAAVPSMAVSVDIYSGGDVQIGGPGSNTISIAEITTAVTQSMAPVPPATLPLTGSLLITTTPGGATVFIDGVQKGISPITIPGLDPGSHTLLLKLDGYQELTLPVAITAGTTQYYSSALVKSGTAPNTAAGTATTRKSSAPGFGAAAAALAVGLLFILRKQ